MSADPLPALRLRRLRASAGLRAMLTETTVEPRHLIQPLFVTEGEAPEPAEVAKPSPAKKPKKQLGYRTEK